MPPHRTGPHGGNPFKSRGNRAGSPRTPAVRKASRSNIRRAQSARTGVKQPPKPR
jgi:hypothetical protein